MSVILWNARAPHVLGRDGLTDIAGDSDTKTSTTQPEAGGTIQKPLRINVQLDHLPDREHINLGNLPYDQSPTFTFHLENTLPQEVVMQALHTDCGCSKAKIIHSAAKTGEDLIWHLNLTPSQRVGRFARKFKIEFANPEKQTLEVVLSGKVIAPLSLDSSTIHCGPARKVETVRGDKRPEIQIVDCQSVRGLVNVVGMRSDDTKFTIEIEPNLSFGKSTDHLRLQFIENRSPRSIDLPIEIICQQKAHFLPSVQIINWIDNESFVRSRIIHHPNHSLPLQELAVAIRGDFESQQNITVGEVRWNRISPVLLELEAKLFRSETVSNSDPIKARKENSILMTVQGPTGESICVLSLIQHAQQEQ